MATDCRLVFVRWEDSRQPLAEWRHLAGLDVPEVSSCATVGWLLKDDKDRKVIAQTIGGLGPGDHPQATGIMVIPARCIISIEDVAEPVTSSYRASESKRKHKPASARQPSTENFSR
jgi:hypothetical protein